MLYLVGGAISKENPWEVLKHYGPAYLTAVGTMSSAATLPVALKSAKNLKFLEKILWISLYHYALTSTYVVLF